MTRPVRIILTLIIFILLAIIVVGCIYLMFTFLDWVNTLDYGFGVKALIAMSLPLFVGCAFFICGIYDRLSAWDETRNDDRKFLNE